MSRVRYRSIVSVGSQDYVGDGRVSVEGAMFSAIRAALKALGLPYEDHISNADVRSNLEQYCHAQQWSIPMHSIECFTYVPERNIRRQKPAQPSQISAEVRVGGECFKGKATFGADQAKASAAREALRQKGKQCQIVGSEDVCKELLRFCQFRGLGNPTYTLCFGSSAPDKVPIAFVPERQCMLGYRRECSVGLLPGEDGPVGGRRDRINCSSEEQIEKGIGFCQNEDCDALSKHFYCDWRVLRDVNNAPRRYYKAKQNFNATPQAVGVRANAPTQMPLGRTCKLPAVAEFCSGC